MGRKIGRCAEGRVSGSPGSSRSEASLCASEPEREEGKWVRRWARKADAGDGQGPVFLSPELSRVCLFFILALPAMSELLLITIHLLNKNNAGTS